MNASWSSRAEDFAPALTGPGYGEAYLEETTWTAATLEDGRVVDLGSGSERGLGLRLLRGAKDRPETLFGCAPEFSPETAGRLRAGLEPETRGAGIAFAAPQTWLRPVRLDPTEVPLARKTALLRALDAVVRAEFPGIRQVTASYRDRVKLTRVLNADGADMRQRLVSVVLSITVVAERDGVLQTGHETLGAQRGFELLSGDEPFAAARRAAARALAKLSAPKARAGEMTVVLASSAGGTFIHEAIGHSLEADLVLEGSSPAYRGAIGKTIAPETITVVDDPTMPFQRGSYAFDDEGVAAAPTTLVQNGVLRAFLHDRATALREGGAPNGHGRRESYALRPIPRMSNLYIAPGKDDPARIVAGLKNGLLVTRMGGGQVNTATGEFVFEVDEGFRVENGKVKELVRDANLLGDGPELLRTIDAVGWDIGWGIGTCGKDGQGVPVSDGQPTIRLPKVVVGGSHE